MIAVIATMGGKIEGDGKAFLSGGKVAAIEGVGLLGSGEAGILADGPGLLDIHCGVGATHERRSTGVGVQKLQAGEIAFAIGALDADAFGSFPDVGADCWRRCLRLGPGMVAKSGILVMEPMPPWTSKVQHPLCHFVKSPPQGRRLAACGGCLP